MPTRSVTIDGAAWRVYPSGYLTPYVKDEFGLIFVRGEGAEREVRVTRYSPAGARTREQSLAELTDAQLRMLFAHSQPGETAPETGYLR